MDFRELAERNKIVEVRAGSHLFGTNTPESDLDLFGVFMPSIELLYGFQDCEGVDFNCKAKDENGRNTSEAVDRRLYEFRKFCKLALQNNPNILHLLFANSESIVFCNDYGKLLLAKAEQFVHKGAYHRFVAYAKSQMHKMLIKPENFEALNAALDSLSLQSDHRTLSELGVPPFIGDKQHFQVGDLHIERNIYVKAAKKLIQDRLTKATHRSSLYTKYGYDVKFGSNLIQLLLEGIELLDTGRIVFPLAYRDRILDIKSGKIPVNEVIRQAEDLLLSAENSFKNSKLPEHPDSSGIEAFVIQQVKKFVV